MGVVEKSEWADFRAAVEMWKEISRVTFTIWAAAARVMLSTRRVGTLRWGVFGTNGFTA